ncbi:MAG: amidohydrolase, partial [Acidimicrobiales bacterium]
MSQPLPGTSGTTVYAARAVHTFDPARATASAVAVRDGRFLAVGDPDDLVATYGGTLDQTLADKVL